MGRGRERWRSGGNLRKDMQPEGCLSSNLIIPLKDYERTYSGCLTTEIDSIRLS